MRLRACVEALPPLSGREDEDTVCHGVHVEGVTDVSVIDLVDLLCVSATDHKMGGMLDEMLE